MLRKKLFFLKKIKSLLYSLKKHSKILPLENSGIQILTLYELCKS